MRRGCMKESDAYAANLAANGGNTIYGVERIDNESALAYIMALHWTDDKPLSEPMLVDSNTTRKSVKFQWKGR